MKSQRKTIDPSDLLELIPETRGRRWVISPLSGGMTNRNYRVDGVDEGASAEGRVSYVLRIAGADTECLGIDRNVEVGCTRAAAQAGLAPQIVAFLPGHGVLLRPFVHGTILTPETIRRPETLRGVVSALRRYHECPPGAGRFCVYATVRSYHTQARDGGVSFPVTMDRALERMDRLEAEFPAIEPSCPCHNDLLAANIIDCPEGLRIIDWEYAGMGDRFFDLGNLAVNNEFTPDDDAQLLEFYFGRVADSHLRRLQCMRRLSDLREALWGFLQAAVSRLEVDYHAYGTRHLERFLASERG